ncbi:hypothetical protein [Stackebrandtia nassauensis]|uniref:Uncharacterized protein n=1 Tax=Stackebrandtia nassauensis (strain DSM 44728 / CIP 108903 / NRRL B-16338 / NBRC 102104 / LLR-40K-21) TaxID=446470 RepID=D3PVD6_STANL|nr:hypothetical protein [Stackebrandtia nassauensis]ADD41189.1 hypothetical protein Snas_1485 [Stackebrandtia nassauensis DSM 44728]
MKNPIDFDASAEFGGLVFDQIRQIAEADRDHAYGIDEQADAADALIKAVDDAITGLGDGFGKVNQPTLLRATDELMAAGDQAVRDGQVEPGMMMVFQGKSARAAITQLIKLGERSKAGALRIAAQPSTLKELAGQVRQTDTEMAALAEDRQRYLDLVAADPASPDLLKVPGVTPGMDPQTVRHAVNMEYDKQARDKMQLSVKGYYDQASKLEAPQAYEGPRVPTPGDRLLGQGDFSVSGGSIGSGGHSSPGPDLRRDVPTTSTVSTSVDYNGFRSGSTGPELTGPANPVTTAPVTTISGPPPSTPASSSVFGPVTSGGHFVPNQSVTRPVYGSRTTPKFGPTRPVLRPNTSGLVRPVIGERPGKSLNAFGRPQQPVVRPGDARTIGAPRTDRLSGRTVPPRTITADPRTTGPARSLAPRTAAADGRVFGGARGDRALTSPARTADGRVIGDTRADRPGVRTTPTRPHTADGRVLRSNPTSTPEFTVRRAEFSREPRLPHGGNDNRDGAALRNSRPLSATPTPTPTPEPRGVAAERDGHWSVAAPRDVTGAPTVNGDWPVSATVPPVIHGARVETTRAEYDPGHYVTPHNLGKRL